MNKIDFTNYKNMSLLEKAKIDYAFQSGLYDIEDLKKNINESSNYLTGFQLQKISYFRSKDFVHKETLSDENELLILCILGENELIQSKDIFSKIFYHSDFKQDIKYNWEIRSKLIKLGILEGSSKSTNGLRDEFISLKESFQSSDLNSIYKHSMQIANNDIKDFTDEEKAIVIKIMKIKSEEVLIAISYSILDEEKIRYGSWQDFWKTNSTYKPGDNVEENYFLRHKSLAMSSDYGDERINMNMFPNLPSIYDEDGFYLGYEIDDIDWSRNFFDYEIDLIIAQSLLKFGEVDVYFISKIDEYIISRKEDRNSHE